MNTITDTTQRKIRLRPKLLADAMNDYRWRKDPLLAYLDAITPITIGFDEYVRCYQEELQSPNKNYVHFGIESQDGKHIGNCMIYDIDEEQGEAQIGILIGERAYWDDGYGQEAVIMLLEKAFQYPGISRIHLQTVRSNARAQTCFARCGFKPCGGVSRNGFELIVMELHRGDWSALRSAEASDKGATA